MTVNFCKALTQVYTLTRNSLGRVIENTMAVPQGPVLTGATFPDLNVGVNFNFGGLCDRIMFVSSEV